MPHNDQVFTEGETTTSPDSALVQELADIEGMEQKEAVKALQQVGNHLYLYSTKILSKIGVGGKLPLAIMKEAKRRCVFRPSATPVVAAPSLPHFA
jgi:hypothetical protein